MDVSLRSAQAPTSALMDEVVFVMRVTRRLKKKTGIKTLTARPLLPHTRENTNFARGETCSGFEEPEKRSEEPSLEGSFSAADHNYR